MESERRIPTRVTLNLRVQVGCIAGAVFVHSWHVLHMVRCSAGAGFFIRGMCFA